MVETTEQDQSANEKELPNTRLHYIDNLRTFIIVLVVLFHTAIQYGGLSYGTLATVNPEPITTYLLTWFVFVQQAYFMGLLFFISGYLTPASFARRGTSNFLRQRLLRLGIPLITYDFLINPFIQYLQMSESGDTLFNLMDILKNYPDYIQGVGTGPMWFVWNLLLFNVGYALWVSISKRKPHLPLNSGQAPANISIFAFLVFLAFSAFTTRIVFPVGWETPLNLRLQYYWQYLTFFIVGLIAWKHQWLVKWPDRIGRTWLGIGMAATLIFPGIYFIGNIQKMQGGFYWQSFGFAAWEATLAIGLGLGLLILFRRYLNKTGRLALTLSTNAYAVYIIHVPVIVLLQLAILPVDLPAFAKFVTVSLITIPACFIFSELILRRIPLSAKILY